LVKEQLLETIDEWREDIIRFTQELVRTPSENPPGDESKVAELCIKKLNELGIDEIEIIAKEEHRPNVLAYLTGSAKKPTLMLSGHLDTKPVGLRDEWITDPLGAEIINGEMYGRGTADMKGAVASMIMAAGALKEVGAELNGRLMLALTADEEAGTHYGADWLVKEKGLRADAGIVTEPSGIDECWDYLTVVVRGGVYFDIIVEGTQMHSSLTDLKGGINACMKLSEVLSRMKSELKLTYKPHPYCPQGPTMNGAVFLKGGIYYGVCPGEAIAGCDIRIIPGMSPESVMADVERFLDKLRREDPKLKVRAEYRFGSIAAEISPDEPIVQVTLKATEEVLGRKPKLGCFPGGTDALHMINVGKFPVIPAFGPGLLYFCHGPNERIPVEDLIRATKIYALTTLYYLK